MLRKKGQLAALQHIWASIGRDVSRACAVARRKPIRNLNDTISRLAAMRDRPLASAGAGGRDRLLDLPVFGSNPGALRCRYYVPEGLEPGSPLVVALHGCMQDAAAYDHGAGWTQLADERGFAVLLPEQQRSNNPNMCFNWFATQDIGRGAGEALSIQQMISALTKLHEIDPARVFVTGLSAGGAMASVLLATYPEVFAGGAIIAGLPYGTAKGVREAFDRMRAHGGPGPAELGKLVTSTSQHRGPWPRVSVWQGDSDSTVSPKNAALVVAQWREVHGLSPEPDHTAEVAGNRYRSWLDREGRAVVEEYTIKGMGHGTPLSTYGPDAIGAAGPYMLEAGISSTRMIARFWGLSDSDQERSGRHDPQPEPARLDESLRPGLGLDIKRTIEVALRSAGLLR